MKICYSCFLGATKRLEILSYPLGGVSIDADVILQPGPLLTSKLQSFANSFVDEEGGGALLSSSSSLGVTGLTFGLDPTQNIITFSKLVYEKSASSLSRSNPNSRGAFPVAGTNYGPFCI